jgi:hypothetical protein
MPYYFTCPKCKQQNHGFKYRPQATENYSENCLLCGQTKITWVADQKTANAYEAEAKQYNEPPHLFAIGWGQSNIPYTEPGVKSSVAQEWDTLLSPYATRNGYFSQGKRQEKMSDEVGELASLADGQCLGQCLHWIRRVLQGSKQTYTVPGEKGESRRSDSDIWERQKKQTREGARVQLAVTKEVKSNSIYVAKRQEFDRRLNEYLLNQGIERVKTGPTTYKWKYLDNSTLTQQEYDELYTKCDEKDKLFANRDLFEYGWDEFAKELDRCVGSKKRRFSGVVATKSVHQKSYNGSSPFATFSKTLCDDDKFCVGSAVLIRVSLPGDNTAGSAGGSIGGHGIAAHYKGNNELYLFDPNAGVFVCQTKSSLEKALVKLVEDGWMGKLGWGIKNEFGYTLFARRDSQPQAGGGETVLVVTPSPTATAYQNKAVIPTSISQTAEPKQVITPKQSTQATSGKKEVPTLGKATPDTPTTGYRPQSPPQHLVKTATATSQTSSSGSGKADLQKWVNEQSVEKYNGEPGGWVQLTAEQAEQVKDIMRTQIRGIDKESVIGRKVIKGRLSGRLPYGILKSELNDIIKKMT